MTWTMTKGEVGKVFTANVKKSNGLAFDATGATVTLAVANQTARTMTLVDAANGVVSYTTVSGDTSTLVPNDDGTTKPYNCQIKFVNGATYTYFTIPHTLEVTGAIT